MASEPIERPIPHETSLRLWPGVLAVLVQWLLRFGVPYVEPDAAMYGALGGLLFGLVVIVWWVFFSRAPRLDRWGAVLLLVVGLGVGSSISHESIATAGQGVMFFVYAIPLVSLALVVWAVACRHLADVPRRAAMVVSLLGACCVWALVRFDGVTGGSAGEFAWRWAQTPEERLLAEGADEPATRSSVAVDGETDVAWPGFRGPDRDGVVRGVRIDADWSAAPTHELWRRAVGPAWSSFAVGRELLYTQEQRGDEEIVACYHVGTGEAVWKHRDMARFWEALGGAGPRATPTLHEGRVYAFGGTGILNVLDAGDGTLVWSRDVAADVETQVPYWGFASSPLVSGDVVVVAAEGELVGYDLATGEPRWSGRDGGQGYSSPHLATIDGVTQVLLMSQAGVTSLAPADGSLLWEHAWPGGTRIVQPALAADGELLLSRGDKKGMRRIAVASGPGGWTTEERWDSVRLKPYFSDFVVHAGHAFGFDGSLLACIDAEDGKRKWKGGRYGSGQLILLADQDLLLVLSEEGELALVPAATEGFTELARFPALEGKTWNHPVLAGDVLLVRNAEEMAAFRLSVVEG